MLPCALKGVPPVSDSVVFFNIVLGTFAVLGVISLRQALRERRAAPEIAKLAKLGGMDYRNDLRQRWLEGTLRSKPSWELRIFGLPVQCCEPIPGYVLQLGYVVDGQKQVISDMSTDDGVKYVGGMGSRLLFRLSQQLS